MTHGLTNWSGNVAFRAARIHRPTSVKELAKVVSGSDRVRALGTGHSFSLIADTTGDLVSVAALPPEVEVDAAGASVTVAGGVRYGEVATRLQQHGLALHNLGSLPHISVAGACATGTHGSGVSNGNLATAVSAIELVTARGDVVHLSRAVDGDRFSGAVISLGCLGVVTRVTLDVQPSFDVRQYVYEAMPREALDVHFEHIVASAYSVSLFTDWRGPDIKQVWVKQRLDADEAFVAESRWLGARLAEVPLNVVPGMPPENCTQQLGVPGLWHERLPHFRLGFTPSAGDELQSEYLLPREAALEAIRALDGVRDRIAEVLLISEIRTVAADDMWLSPSYHQHSVAFHFTWIKEPDAVTPVVRLIEERLLPLGARPHWGKVFTTSPAVISDLYERLPDFQRLRREFDPGGKFGNDFVDEYLGA